LIVLRSNDGWRRFNPRLIDFLSALIFRQDMRTATPWWAAIGLSSVAGGALVGERTTASSCSGGCENARASAPVLDRFLMTIGWCGVEVPPIAV
jgi:hypothetical protein